MPIITNRAPAVIPRLPVCRIDPISDAITAENTPTTAQHSSSPGRMTRTTGTAYSSVWVSGEYPKTPRSSPYSALGRLLPMNKTARATLADTKARRAGALLGGAPTSLAVAAVNSQ